MRPPSSFGSGRQSRQASSGGRGAGFGGRGGSGRGGFRDEGPPAEITGMSIIPLKTMDILSEILII